MFFFFDLEEFKLGSLTIHAERAGTISEVTSFLSDLDSAYVALLRLDSTLRPFKSRKRFYPPDILWGLGPLHLSFSPDSGQLGSNSVPPEFRLLLNRVRIESPGFWEFLGSLNPLQQIREYLSDRHKRRQDREFREPAEMEKLRMENELIQRSIWEKDNTVLRDRIAVLRDLGYTDSDIRQLVWTLAGPQLAKLGTHQDRGLIEGTE